MQESVGSICVVALLSGVGASSGAMAFLNFRDQTEQGVVRVLGSLERGRGDLGKMKTGVVAIGADHAGFDLKEILKQDLKDLGMTVVDCGARIRDNSDDYPDFAQAVSRAVASDEAEFGLLVCATGVGMSISANKVPGVRAALAADAEIAELARRHNHANVLCLSGKRTSPEEARKILKTFLSTPFDGGRHDRRVGRIESGRKYPVAIWLALEPEQQRQLQEIICDLSEKYSDMNHFIPVFQPHVTLCSIPDLPGCSEALSNLFQRIDDLCATQVELHVDLLDARPIDCRDTNNYGDLVQDAWSTFEFVALNPEQAVPILQAVEAGFPEFTVKKDPKDPEKKRLMPHLSLIYCYPTNRQGIDRRYIETNWTSFSDILPRLPRRFSFTGIQAVTPRSGDWSRILRDPNERWDVIYTSKFEKSPTYSRLHMVVAGGQTGVDQAALRAALRAGFLIAGWCPPAGVIWINDDGTRETVPAEFHLRPTDCDRSANCPDVARSQRTEWNVRDSDATLVIVDPQKPIIDRTTDPGTDWTVRCAVGFGRPYLICDPSNTNAVERVASWVCKNDVRTLNVAGPRENSAGDIGRTAEKFLYDLFARLRTGERYLGTAADSSRLAILAK